jgi:hypothetical protein
MPEHPLHFVASSREWRRANVNGQPSPPPPVEAPGFFTGIRPVAVALGALVDQISTMVLNLILLGWIAEEYESAPGVIDEEALQALARDPDMLAAWLCIGTFCTGFGGFMAARMAACHHGRHGAFVGLAGILMGLLAYGAQPTAYPPPLWYDLLSFGVLVPAGAIGGALSSRFRRPADEPPPER